MNKSQKKVIAITLLVMALILIYPPVEEYVHKDLYDPDGRAFLFLIDDLIGTHRLNIMNLIAELLVVGILGGAIIIFFGLKKR